jgi:UDPglucose 6-dehydrogenase
MNTVNIAKIEIFEYDGKVYNVEVEPNHPTKDDQFFVQSNTGLVVHNCHPRDNIALRYMAQELDLGYDLFEAIMRAREVQAENLAKELVKHAEQNGMPIYIHGKAYKPQVSYLDGSYSLLVGHYVEKLGFTPIYIDPYTGDDVEPTEPGVFLMAHSASITYDYTKKNTKDEIYCAIPPGSIIVDPWRKITSSVSTVIHYGNTRHMQ